MWYMRKKSGPMGNKSCSDEFSNPNLMNGSVRSKFKSKYFHTLNFAKWIGLSHQEKMAETHAFAFSRKRWDIAFPFQCRAIDSHANEQTYNFSTYCTIAATIPSDMVEQKNFQSCGTHYTVNIWLKSRKIFSSC